MSIFFFQPKAYIGFASRNFLSNPRFCPTAQYFFYSGAWNIEWKKRKKKSFYPSLLPTFISPSLTTENGSGTNVIFEYVTRVLQRRLTFPEFFFAICLKFAKEENMSGFQVEEKWHMASFMWKCPRDLQVFSLVKIIFYSRKVAKDRTNIYP